MEATNIPGTKTVNKGSALADYIRPRSYGDIIRYQEIEQVTGEKRGSQRYYSAVAKAKKLLEASGKMIQRLSGGDYQILYPGDYAEAAAREVRLANRRIKHGSKILDVAPLNDMSAEERAVHNRMRDGYAVLQARMNGAVVEVKTLTGQRKHPLALAAQAERNA